MINQSTEHRQRILREINRAIDDLPMLPSAVSELMSLSISDDSFFEKVKVLAEQDPTFTARLIKVANSAASAPISQITSISHAVSRIGTRQIKGLITAYAVSKIFIPSNSSELNLWVHSIQVAVASQSIAQMATRLKIAPEQAYLCGLLHDIGRFILFNKVPDGPVRIDETDWESPEKLLEIEKEICGLTHAALGVIHDGSEHALELLEELLEWAKLHSDGYPITIEKMMVKPIVLNSIDLYSLTALDKGCTLLDKTEDIALLADPHALDTILRNLVTNAIKFTEKGIITIGTISDKNTVSIYVKDMGQGMDEETCQKILSKDDYHTTTGTNGEKGTGLGLAICTELASKQNGVISVESVPGEGSKFQISLPRGS